jgi:hypothetical protein
MRQLLARAAAAHRPRRRLSPRRSRSRPDTTQCSLAARRARHHLRRRRHPAPLRVSTHCQQRGACAPPQAAWVHAPRRAGASAPSARPAAGGVAGAPAAAVRRQRTAQAHTRTRTRLLARFHATSASLLLQLLLRRLRARARETSRDRLAGGGRAAAAAAAAARRRLRAFRRCFLRLWKPVRKSLRVPPQARYAPRRGAQQTRRGRAAGARACALFRQTPLRCPCRGARASGCDARPRAPATPRSARVRVSRAPRHRGRRCERATRLLVRGARVEPHAHTPQRPRARHALPRTRLLLRLADPSACCPVVVRRVEARSAAPPFNCCCSAAC